VYINNEHSVLLKTACVEVILTHRLCDIGAAAVPMYLQAAAGEMCTDKYTAMWIFTKQLNPWCRTYLNR